MPLISIIAVLIILGLVLWLIGYLPIDPGIRKIITVVAVIAVILWLLSLLGVFHGGMRF